MIETAFPAQQLSPRSTHRSPPIALPADAGQAAAYVLSFVQSGDLAFDRSAAIEGMNERIDQLQASDADVMERELFAHAQILSALFLRFTAQSVAATGAEHKAVYMKTALACQAAYTKTCVCVEGLRWQQQGRGSIRVNGHAQDE
jgi:hypothetical protein